MPSTSSSASMSSASRSLAKSPSAGCPLQPKPRRSGAITRKRAASGGITSRQAHQCCGQPWTSSSGGAAGSPASATCSRTPVAGRLRGGGRRAPPVRTRTWRSRTLRMASYARAALRDTATLDGSEPTTTRPPVAREDRRRRRRDRASSPVMVTAARGVYDVSPYPVAVASAPRWTMPVLPLGRAGTTTSRSARGSAAASSGARATIRTATATATSSCSRGCASGS